MKLNFRKSAMETQSIHSRQRQIGHQHLFRVRRNEPKGSEDVILMKESRMVSKETYKQTKTRTE